jgi:hypothetical protein
MGVKMKGDWGLFSDLARKAQKFSERASEAAALSVKEYLERELPRAPGGEVYGAVTVEKSNDGGKTVWKVLVDVLPEKIETLDPKASAFYIRDGSVAGEIIAQQNPYTFDTLPIYTGIENAEIIYRRVRAAEVSVISADRKKGQQELTTQLNKIGAQARFGASGFKHEVSRDAIFQLRRMEYGVPSEPSNPIMGRIDSENIVERAVMNDNASWKELLG